MNTLKSYWFSFLGFQRVMLEIISLRSVNFRGEFLFFFFWEKQTTIYQTENNRLTFAREKHGHANYIIATYW